MGLRDLSRWVPRAGRAAATVLGPGERPTDAFEERWRGDVKRRVIVIVGFVALWAAAVEARFVYLQVVKHEWLLEAAADRQERTVTDKAERGEIVDRNGQILAYSVDADTIIAVPASIKDPGQTADALCSALGDCTPASRRDLIDRLSTKKPFAWVRRMASPQQAARVAALKLDGIGLRTETKRFYPKKELASHVVGFVNTDGRGLAGVELAYQDKYIAGRDGQSQIQIDARGRTVQSRVEVPTQSGATVELTIDQYLQHIVERELQDGVEKYNAVSGSVVVMDPMNGEILAEASYPTYNPNAAGSFERFDRVNRAIEYVYEPGSTFKIVTASAAFEEGVFRPDELIETSPGRLSVPGRSRQITEAKGHDYGTLTFADVLIRSSNVGAVKIGYKVGAERMEKYIRRFGFGERTGQGLAGESAGIVHSLASLSQSSLASMSMGYEIGVTPLQMAAAASSIANGGTLYKPHIVRAVIQDGVRKVAEPQAVRRTVSENTAAAITGIMEQVVAGEHGTAKLAAVDGYQIAGKTGTAAKAIPGGYSRTDYNVSFVGFLPSRAPRLTILVVIDTPRNGSAYGGSVAAPIFQKIAEAAMRQMGVPRSVNPVPPVLMRANADAINELVPPPAPAAVPIVFDGPAGSVIPDVRGLSAREATRVLAKAGLGARLSGTGVVEVQAPEPGMPLEKGTYVNLQLARGGVRR